MAGIPTQFIGECGQPNVPGLYANVGKSVCFITSAIQCRFQNKYFRSVTVPSDCGENWIQDNLEKAKKVQAKKTKKSEKLQKIVDALQELADSCN